MRHDDELPESGELRVCEDLTQEILVQRPQDEERIPRRCSSLGEEIARHGLEGADAPLLPKPFKPSELTEQVKRLLERDPETP